MREAPPQAVIARNTVLPLISRARAEYLPKRSKPPAFHIPNSVNSWEVLGSFDPPNPKLLKDSSVLVVADWKYRSLVTLTEGHSQGGSSPAETSQDHQRLDPPLSTLFMKQGSQFRIASGVLSLAPERWSEVLTMRERQSVIREFWSSPQVNQLIWNRVWKRSNLKP